MQFTSLSHLILTFLHFFSFLLSLQTVKYFGQTCQVFYLQNYTSANSLLINFLATKCNLNHQRSHQHHHLHRRRRRITDGTGRRARGWGWRWEIEFAPFTLSSEIINFTNQSQVEQVLPSANCNWSVTNRERKRYILQRSTLQHQLVKCHSSICITYHLMREVKSERETFFYRKWQKREKKRKVSQCNMA